MNKQEQIKQKIQQLKDDREAKDRLISQLRTDLRIARAIVSNAGDQDIFEKLLNGVDKLIQRKDPIFPSEFSLKETELILGALEKIAAKEPLQPKEEVKVSNLSEIVQYNDSRVIFGLKHVQNAILGLLDGVKGLASSVFKAQVTGEVRVTNNDISEAIPVRLVSRDMKFFYDAMVSVMGSGGSSLTTDKLTDILAAIRSIGGSATSMTEGRKVVAVTNTAVVLGSGACKTIFINALTTNSNVVVVGGAGVIFTEATRTGKILYPGDGITVSINDLSKIYINGTAGDGVSFSYVN